MRERERLCERERERERLCERELTRNKESVSDVNERVWKD